MFCRALHSSPLPSLPEISVPHRYPCLLYPAASADLATARKQVARIGTLFAYAYNVAVAAGAFGEGEPPRLRLEAQIVFARLKALPPAQLEQMVELVPAEGERHMMRVRVTGLAGCAINP